MGNRVYLYNINSEKDDDILEIGEAQNRIPLLWCLLFTIEDLIIRAECIKDEKEEYDGENSIVELSCLVSKAIENIKNKGRVANQKGVDWEIITQLEELVKHLRYNNIVAQITEYSYFFSTEGEMREDLKSLLNLVRIEPQFPSQTCALDLTDFYTALEIPMSESIKKLEPQVFPLKLRKKKIETFKPFDDQGNLIEEYFKKYGFEPEFFNKDNDHNPLVLHICNNCEGRGTVRWDDPPIGDITCDVCFGTGCEETARPIFHKSNVVYQPLINNEFTHCPSCKKTFSTKDKRRWTGLRHWCGQKIIPLRKGAPLLNFFKKLIAPFKI